VHVFLLVYLLEAIEQISLTFLVTSQKALVEQKTYLGNQAISKV